MGIWNFYKKAMQKDSTNNKEKLGQTVYDFIHIQNCISTSSWANLKSIVITKFGTLNVL